MRSETSKEYDALNENNRARGRTEFLVRPLLFPVCVRREKLFLEQGAQVSNVFPRPQVAQILQVAGT